MLGCIVPVMIGLACDTINSSNMGYELFLNIYKESLDCGWLVIYIFKPKYCCFQVIGWVHNLQLAKILICHPNYVLRSSISDYVHVLLICSKQFSVSFSSCLWCWTILVSMNQHKICIQTMRIVFHCLHFW